MVQKAKVLTDQQDQRLGRAVKKIEQLQIPEPPDPEIPYWMPRLARVLPGTEVNHGYRGKCNPLKGTGAEGVEMDPDGFVFVSPGQSAIDFLSSDTSIELTFLNLTGGIVTLEDILVLFRVAVPLSGSATRGGGIWAAINGVNHVHFGSASGTISAGGSGQVSSNTETGASSVVNLFSSHGDEDISSGKEIIYVRRYTDRLVIAAECETTAQPVAAVPGYSTPLPADGAVVVDVDTTLGWSGGAGIDDLYFGTTGNLVLTAQGLTADTFSFAGSLEENTVYEWAVRSQSAVTGEVKLSPLWSFTTGPNVVLKTFSWTARAQWTASLAGGSVDLETDTWTASATASMNLAGGRVEMETDDWTADAVWEADLSKF